MLAWLGGHAHQNVFFDGQTGKDFAALGYVGHAECGACVRGEFADVVAVKVNAARGQGLHAHQALQQGGFAYAVASEQGHALALFD